MDFVLFSNEILVEERMLIFSVFILVLGNDIHNHKFDITNQVVSGVELFLCIPSKKWISISNALIFQENYLKIFRTEFKFDKNFALGNFFAHSEIKTSLRYNSVHSY